MVVIKEGYGYRAGAKMRFIKNRHESLSYKIPKGFIGKLHHILDFGGEGHIVLKIYNPEWVDKTSDGSGILSFWVDEVEVCI